MTLPHAFFTLVLGMENENDMSVKHPAPPPATPSHVGRVAVGIAIVLFFLGLVLYIADSGQIQTATQSQQNANETARPSASTTPKAERVKGQVIVKFKAGVSDQQITERLAPLNASIKSKISGINTTVLNVPPGQEDAVLQALADDPLVQYAEPDYIYYLQFTPNDAQLGQQWGLVNTGQTVNNKVGKVDADIDAEFAWDVSRGTGVTVAVLDSGIDTAHPELSSKVKGTKSFTNTPLADKNGHGTHVAGILAANTNNGQGVAGVCPDCQLLIGKITNDDTGGTVPGSAIAPGITWAADSGVQVINLSIAGPSFSQAVQDAVNYAWGKNIVIVAAAGNSGSSTKAYPAAYTNVLAVGNTTSTDVKRSDSNFGTWVDVAAPGDTIYSTIPTTTSFVGKTNTSYGFLSGTSMASPAVAGVAALVWKTQFGTNNAAVVQRITSTAEKIAGTGTNWVHGRVNAASAVGASTIPTGAPTSVPSPVPTGQVSVVPTFVCGGSTNSICPIPSVSNPVQPSGTTNPTGTTQPTTAVPTTSVSPTPCEASGATTAHSRKSKHKKKSKGGVNRFVDFILRFFIELLNMLLKLIGGGQIPVPGNPGNPVDPVDPVDPGTPCEPLPEPSEVPTEEPEPTTQPSTAQPISVIPSIIASIVPSSTPNTSTVPVGKTVVFTGDYNTGNFSQWSNCQWEGYNGGCSSYNGASRMAKIVNDGPGHETAARFEVQPGDVAPGAGGERSEVRAGGAGDVVEGDERWYEFSLKVPSDFKPPVGANSGGHFIVMQWHSGSGSPPLHVSMDASNNLILWHRWDSKKKVIGPVDPGNWHNYILHVKFSNSASGFVEVWRDGQQVVPKTMGANMASSSNYLKMGLYRGGEDFGQVVLHDGLRITAP